MAGSVPDAIPVVALTDLDPTRVVDALATTGVLLVERNGTGDALLERLRACSAQWFAQPAAVRSEDRMERFGRRWRGWFPLGGELTAGRPDGKEGYYLGLDLPEDDARVRAGLPLHGPNPVPTGVPELGEAVADWMRFATDVGQSVLAALADGLGLGADWFRAGWCDDPTVLFRIFRYPATGDLPDEVGHESARGVGEHTDYGLVTVLAHDGTAGLEVRPADRWIPVPEDPDRLVVNIGDMLERATGGFLRSTVHRVRSQPGERWSFPLFLDPGWDVRVDRLPIDRQRFRPTPRARPRWDGEDPLEAALFDGTWTYGEYLTRKVSRVFPHLVDPAPSDGSTEGTGRWPAQQTGRMP